MRYPYVDSQRRDANSSVKNEIALLQATLLRAIKDLKCREGNRHSAIAWFLDEQHHHVCSFVPLCLALGLDPERVRRKVFTKYKVEVGNETVSD
jgi:hypothetical protein